MNTSVYEPAAIQKQIQIIHKQITALGKNITTCNRELTRIRSSRDWGTKDKQMQALRYKITACWDEIKILKEGAESLGEYLQTH